MTCARRLAVSAKAQPPPTARGLTVAVAGQAVERHAGFVAVLVPGANADVAHVSVGRDLVLETRPSLLCFVASRQHDSTRPIAQLMRHWCGTRAAFARNIDSKSHCESATSIPSCGASAQHRFQRVHRSTTSIPTRADRNIDSKSLARARKLDAQEVRCYTTSIPTCARLRCEARSPTRRDVSRHLPAEAEASPDAQAPLHRSAAFWSQSMRADTFD